MVEGSYVEAAQKHKNLPLFSSKNVRLRKFVLKTAFSLLYTNCDPTLEW